MSTETTDLLSITPEQRRLIDRGLKLHEQFSQAMIANDELDEEVPNRCVLVLIPDQDPELAEVSLRDAIDAARRGRNVYIRHVYRQNTPSEQYGDYAYGPNPPEQQTEGEPPQNGSK